MNKLPLIIVSLLFLLTGNIYANQPINEQLQQLERKFNRKLGIYAIDTSSNKVIAHRANERFPFQSTLKFIGAAALLHQDTKQGLINKKVIIKQKDIVPWAPISSKFLNKKASLETLAMAAVSFSDNTAINIIVRQLGGLNAINAFARKTANKSFQLNHDEPNLNSDPSKKFDTATPKDMALSVQNILLGNVLKQQQRMLLLDWMKNNTTGYKRIRAGVPLGWLVADKTGSGRYGIANDVGIIWSPADKPIVLAIFSKNNNANDLACDQVVAAATEVILAGFGSLKH